MRMLAACVALGSIAHHQQYIFCKWVKSYIYSKNEPIVHMHECVAMYTRGVCLISFGLMISGEHQRNANAGRLAGKRAASIAHADKATMPTTSQNINDEHTISI